MNEMRVLLLMGLLLFVATRTTTAQGISDSLSQVIERATGAERVAALNLAVRQIQLSDPKQAEALAKEAYELAESIGNQQAQHTSAVQLGILWRDQDRLNRAERYAKTSLELANAMKSDSARLESYALLRTIYLKGNRTGKLPMVELQYQKLLNQLKREQTTNQIYSLQENLAASEEQNLAINSRLEEIRQLTEADQLRQAAIQAELGRQSAELATTLAETQRESAERALKLAEQEQELERTNAQVKRQRIILIALGAGLLLALALAVIIQQNFRLRRSRATERAKAQRQLMMQEKMASLGELAAGIAHEIKNPLNFVKNFSEGSVEIVSELEDIIEQLPKEHDEKQLLLLSELTTELRQNSNDIQQNSARIDRIVKSMLEQASGNEGEIQTVDLNELVKESVHLAHSGYRGAHPNFTLQVQADYDPSIPRVELIPQDIGRALLNIVGNACYAMHQRQRAADESYQPLLKVTTTKQDELVEIRIHDNGPGVPKSDQAHIFTPFFTTKPAGESSAGLGLSISQDIIVQGHHGQLTLESREGHFSCFIIRLPL